MEDHAGSACVRFLSPIQKNRVRDYEFRSGKLRTHPVL